MSMNIRFWTTIVLLVLNLLATWRYGSYTTDGIVDTYNHTIEMEKALKTLIQQCGVYEDEQGHRTPLTPGAPGTPSTP